jgi:hypothetical protein
MGWIFCMSGNTIKQCFPELFAQISGDLNEVSAGQITIGQTKKIWWQCPLAEDHIWEATPAGRVYAYKKKGAKRPDGKTYGCPFCRGIKVAKSNSLVGTHPQLSTEWSIKNNNFLPEQFTAGSARIVWWVCKNDHHYSCSIYDRTREDRVYGCPECSSKSSAPEFRIVSEFEHMGFEVQHRYQSLEGEIDVFIPKLNLGIEYDGAHWHKDKNKHDLAKYERISSSGVTLIRIREKPLPIQMATDLSCNSRSFKFDDFICLVRKMLTFVSEDSASTLDGYLALNRFADNEAYYRKLYNSSSVDIQDSIGFHYPWTTESWDYSKNFPLTPESVSKGSNISLFWRCPKGHEFEKTIHTALQVDKFLGCSFCGGRIPSDSNNLEKKYPVLASQYDRKKNTISANKITPGSSRNVWWICEKGHQFQRIVKRRTSNGETDPCPRCVKDSHRLANNYPLIASQFDKRKNSQNINSLTPKSSDYVWWICECGNSFRQTVKTRTSKGDISECPGCKTKA